MSLQLPEGVPPGLAQALQGGQGLPAALQGPPPGQDDDQGYSELDCLKDVIDDFPRLLTELTDPKDVQDAVSALRLLAGVQTRLMSAQAGPGGSQPQNA